MMRNPDDSETDLAAELERLRHRLALRQASEARQAWTRAEAALTTDDERFRSIFESAPDAIFALDAAGCVSAVNAAGESLLGRTRAELLGKAFREFVSASERETVDRLLDGERIDVAIERPTGESTRVEIAWGLVETADSDGPLVGIARPLRERMAPEANGVSPDVRLFEMAPLGIARLNRDGVVQACNPALLDLVGYEAPDMEGRPFEDFVHPEDSPPLVEHFRKLMRERSVGRCRREARCRRRNGDFEWTSLTVATIQKDGGEVDHAVVTVEDISERRELEQSLRAANERLTSWVADLEQRSREHSLVSETGDLLQACRSADEAYGVIVRMGRRLFSSESGSVCTIGGTTNLVEVVASWGTPPGERLFGADACWALRRGRPHVVQGEESGPLCRHMPAPPDAGYVCVPMMAYGEAVGLLTISVPGETEMSVDRQRLATTVAEHIALSLANLKLQETLRSQSIRDPLTGLFNRRYMEESLEREMRRAGRTRRPVGIIMLDLDHFKTFNDTHGHEVGDALLREVGAVLQRSIRGEDIACRYGGEEFILILPDAPLRDAAQRAEHLREAIGTVDVVRRHQAVGPVTVSLGVAIYPDHGSTSEAVLRAADAALYQAKALGRDRVEVHRGIGDRGSETGDRLPGAVERGSGIPNRES